METEITDAQVDAAFAEGFGPSTDTPTEQPELAENAEPAPEVPPIPVPEYVQVTKQQLEQFQSNATKVQEITAALEQRFGTAFGKIGGLERTLKELQTATPAGQAVQIDDKDFAEMEADFPELAKMSKAALGRILSRLKGTGTPAFDEKKIG